LDFTQEELDPRITFTRGSIGTRVNRNRLIETVDANQPRFDYDPVTGECKGLLIEESRQNLFTNSNDFTVWTKQTTGTGVVGITTNYTTSPDGTTNATRYFIQNGGGTFYSIFRGVSPISANTSYSYSIFVKASTTVPVPASSFTLVVFDGSIASFVTYNLNTGTIQSTFANTNLTIGSGSTITNYGNGWYRCVFVFSHSVGGSGFQFKADIGSTRHNQELFIYGAQLEAGAFPTSYIPTTASTVTRSADTASMTGTNFSSWYNQNEGTIYVNNKIPYTPSSVSLYFLIFGINAGNRHSIEQTTANGLTYITQNSGGIQYWSTSGSGVLPANTNRKTTYAYSSSNIKTLLSGTSNQTYTFSVKSTTDVYKSMTTMYIGRFSDSLYFLNGTISRLTYYPRALKPNQLQLLTQ
jgi:hypothetical protein